MANLERPVSCYRAFWVIIWLPRSSRFICSAHCRKTTSSLPLSLSLSFCRRECDGEDRHGPVMVCWRAKPLMASQSPRRMEAVIESPGERTSCRTFPRPTTGSSHDDDVRGGTRGRRRRRWRAGTGTSSSYSHSSSDSVISAVIVLLVCLLAATGCASQESDKQAVEQEIER